MKLNTFEKKVVGHPLRFWVQNHIESKIISSVFSKESLSSERALEIGCGFGNGIHLINRIFTPNQINAIDFDPQMVSKSQRRHQNNKNIAIDVGNAEALKFDDNTFDKVFDFAVFHHIPDWQTAIKEVYRILRPKGYFFIEDLYRNAICNPISKRLFQHPQCNRFNHGELMSCLIETGFEVKKSYNTLNLFGIILAQKPVNHPD